MKYKLSTLTGLKNLDIRQPVYWQKLQAGWHVGFRKTGQDSAGIRGSWHARYTDLNNGNARSQISLGSDIPADADGFIIAEQRAREFCEKQGAADTPNFDPVDLGRTVQQAVDGYIANRKTDNGHLSGHHADLVLKKHVSEEIFNTPLVALEKPTLRDWRNGLINGANGNKPISRTTANRVIADLLAALNMAYDDGVVDSNMAWRTPKNKKKGLKFANETTARKVFLTPDQESALLDACTGQFKVLVEAALLTGSRPPGELANLRVEDFSATQGTLYISADTVGSGKTGFRTVILSDNGVAFFKRQAKGKTPRAYLIPRDDGEKWLKSNHQVIWNRAVKATAKNRDKARRIPPEATLYCCRHTAISRMLLNGVKLQVVTENVGTSILMIEKHYGHFLNSDRRAMLNAAEAGQ